MAEISLINCPVMLALTQRRESSGCRNDESSMGSELPGPRVIQASPVKRDQTQDFTGDEGSS